jgi:hypothetical protein
MAEFKPGDVVQVEMTVEGVSAAGISCRLPNGEAILLQPHELKTEAAREERVRAERESGTNPPQYNRGF